MYKIAVYSPAQRTIFKKKNLHKLFAYPLFVIAVGVFSVLALNGRDNVNNKFSEFHQSEVPAFARPYRASETQFQDSGGWYTVIRVIDGDTIEVGRGGEPTTIRLIGIDSPEVVDPRKTVQCLGIEASKRAKELLSGKTVRLEKDLSQSEQDKYGRTLRYVFLQDGIFFNKLMISEGYAREYTYRNHQYIYQHEFEEAQREAREEKVGLWKDGACAKILSK